jgi:copper chaperone NosL
MRARFAAPLVLALLASPAACDSPDAAVDPVWGRQPCAHCGMLVGDPRTAAELVDADGRRFFFDDVGCLVVFEHDLGHSPRRAWAHDAQGPHWLDVDVARFVEDDRTPMDFGFVAHAGSNGARFDEIRPRILQQLGRVGGDDGIP